MFGIGSIVLVGRWLARVDTVITLGNGKGRYHAAFLHKYGGVWADL